jgi:hypothetical protein
MRPQFSVVRDENNAGYFVPELPNVTTREQQFISCGFWETEEESFQDCFRNLHFSRTTFLCNAYTLPVKKPNSVA